MTSHAVGGPPDHVLALDCDGTLTEVGAAAPDPRTLAAIGSFVRAGGAVIPLSGRGGPHLRATLGAIDLTVGIGECGYLLVRRSGNDELLVPRGFFDLYGSSEDDPLGTIAALGIPGFLATYRRAGAQLFRPHRNHDRRATYCVAAPRHLVDLDRVRSALNERFGHGITMFRNGAIDWTTLPGGHRSPVDSFHIAPRDPEGAVPVGKANGLHHLGRMLGVPPTAVHFGGDSLHDLESGIAAGARTFGVGNCDEPERWRSAGAQVMTGRAGSGVREYLTQTFSIPTIAGAA